MYNSLIKKYNQIRNLLRGSTIRSKSARGALILTGVTITERVIRLVRNMILARLLAPEDFGLMAIIMAILVVTETLTDVGVPQAIIQNKKGDTREFLNVAWWLQFIRGSGLFILGWFLAPLISSFYERPELVDLLRVTFSVDLLRGIGSPKMFALEKNFRFGTFAIISQGGSLFGTFITVALALYMRNPWILVIGKVSESVFRCIFSYIICPFFPSLPFDPDSFRDLIRYSRGMFGASFLTILSMQTDIFVLGKLMPTAEVGLYTLAISLAQQPVALFSQILGRILLPAFSQKQDNKNILRQTLRKIIAFMIVVGLPSVITAGIFAGPILSIIYGQRYSEAAQPFAVLCFAMLFRIQGAILSSVFMALGQPHIHRRSLLILNAVLLSLIYPAIKSFGLTGAAGSLLIANAVLVLFQTIGLRKLIDFGFKDYYNWCNPQFFQKIVK